MDEIPDPIKRKYLLNAPFHYLVHLIVATAMQMLPLTEEDLDDSIVLAKEKIRRLQLEKQAGQRP